MLLTLVFTLIIVGLIAWVVQAFLPIDGRIKQAIYILLGLYVIVVALSMLGVTIPGIGPLLRY